MAYMTNWGISHDFLLNAWAVLLLFLVPIGGGIPAGVVLGQSRGIPWPMIAFLYLLSDVVLACAFEPVLLYLIRVSKQSPRLSRIKDALAHSTKRTLGRTGINPGPFSLIMITFGTDPMTGRAIALAAGHGFIPGWTLTIIGDMLYFFVIMASTLWLNHILGDGTWTTIIIVIAMIGIPPAVRWVRKKIGI